MTDRRLAQAEAQARVAWQAAARAEAEAQQLQANLHAAEGRTMSAYAAASKARAESVHARAAVDELRDVFKRWFLDAHAGLDLRTAMEGIGGDLKMVLDIADEAKGSAS